MSGIRNPTPIQDISQMGRKLIVAGIQCKLAKKVACEYSVGSITKRVRISNSQLGSDFKWCSDFEWSAILVRFLNGPDHSRSFSKYKILFIFK